MKALTLWQPWASLVAVGAKTIETRSWSTKYRGPLAIHAAKGERWAHGTRIGAFRFYRTGKDQPARMRSEAVPGGCAIGPSSFLPLGAVICTATLADVVPIVSWSPLDGPPVWAAHMIPGPNADPDLERLLLVRDAEMAEEVMASNGPLPAAIDATDQLPYGDFTPGRFAWLLEDVKATTELCPACWGEGDVDDDGNPAWLENPCPVCGRDGFCPPVPAKGHQGLWEWVA